MLGQIEWMTATNGGKNVQNGDKSFFAGEAMMLGLPSKQEATVTSAANVDSDSGVGCRLQPITVCLVGRPN